MSDDKEPEEQNRGKYDPVKRVNVEGIKAPDNKKLFKGQY